MGSSPVLGLHTAGSLDPLSPVFDTNCSAHRASAKPCIVPRFSVPVPQNPGPSWEENHASRLCLPALAGPYMSAEDMCGACFSSPLSPVAQASICHGLERDLFSINEEVPFGLAWEPRGDQTLSTLPHARKYRFFRQCSRPAPDPASEMTFQSMDMMCNGNENTRLGHAYAAWKEIAKRNPRNISVDGIGGDAGDAAAAWVQGRE